MAIISFSDKPEETWGVAGWAFRQILDDVMEQFPHDVELHLELERARERSGLGVDLLPPELASRLTHAIRHVAQGVLDGTIHSGIADKPYRTVETLQQYNLGLRNLLCAMPVVPTKNSV